MTDDIWMIMECPVTYNLILYWLCEEHKLAVWKLRHIGCGMCQEYSPNGCE